MLILVDDSKLFNLIAVKLNEFRIKRILMFARFQVYGPVLLAFESFNFKFALNYQPERGALYTASRKAATDFLP